MAIIMREIRELGGYEPRETLKSHQDRSMTRGSKQQCNGLRRLEKLSINDPPFVEHNDTLRGGVNQCARTFTNFHLFKT